MAYSRKLAGLKPRGPARKLVEAPHVEAHNAWLRMAKATVLKRMDPQEQERRRERMRNPVHQRQALEHAERQLLGVLRLRRQQP